MRSRTRSFSSIFASADGESGIASSDCSQDVVNGKVTYVHTLSVNMNPKTPSAQADDAGNIVR